SMYSALPGLLDGNPFKENGQLQVPDRVSVVLEVLMETLGLLKDFLWSRGVQIRANLDLLMDCVQSAGLGELAAEFFQKLSAAVNILATPKESLLQ
ncbi:hypothetical protein CRUP_027514, partial [Coryphaenoides rupestris]